MTEFSYIAYDKLGRKITGTEEANSYEEVISRLQTKELIVANVFIKRKEKPSYGKGSIEGAKQFKHYRVSTSDLTLFCRQFATLLDAGVSLLKSIEIISGQAASKRLYQILQEIKKDMEQGKSLHEAMEKHPRVFSELWVSLIESGETSGNLALVLERLSKYLERRQEFKRKIISALIYPAILITAGIAALLFLTLKIIPTFAQLFESFGIKLPLVTRILINISKFLRSYIIFILLGIGILFFLFREYIKTKSGRKKYERIKFSLPIFGDFFKAIVVERFSSEISTLIESGVPIIYSLEIAQRSVDNLVAGEIIEKIKENVRQGKPLSEPLEKSDFFEPMVVQMVRVGEEIGELAPMFKRINSFYQELVETFLARFISLFEPIMILFMAGVIGAMVIGMFLPIFQIAQLGGK
ncbi:MAG: type II secretion system F family protein [Candidatus Omnitrophica bacterium]|nr:type II secretion system F family protein [Candidatus Omnitrophota bacterium]